jgi:hypothetical protein
MTETKTCYRCKETFSIVKFHKSNRGKRRGVCSDCVSIENKQRYHSKKNKDRVKNRKQLLVTSKDRVFEQVGFKVVDCTYNTPQGIQKFCPLLDWCNMGEVYCELPDGDLSGVDKHDMSIWPESDLEWEAIINSYKLDDNYYGGGL